MTGEGALVARESLISNYYSNDSPYYMLSDLYIRGVRI